MTVFLGAIFDLDGVITDTARLHDDAWRAVICAEMNMVKTGTLAPPYGENDYQLHFAGRERADGLRSYLASRGVILNEGRQAEMCAKKNAIYLALLESEGVPVNPEILARMALYSQCGVRIMVASSSKNAKHVLHLANLDHLTVNCVDGNDVERLKLTPKPNPAIFMLAAEQMGVPYDQCVVFEDSAAALEHVAPARGILVKKGNAKCH